MAHRPEIQVTLQNPVMAGPLMSTLPSLWASILARQVAAGLLKGVAVPGEIDATQRGMPYNVTTEMDLKLWSIAAKGEQSAFRVGRSLWSRVSFLPVAALHRTAHGIRQMLLR